MKIIQTLINTFKPIDRGVGHGLEFTHKMLDSAMQWLPLTFIIALSPGVTIAILTFINEAPQFLSSNEMPKLLLPTMLPTMMIISATSIGLVFLGYLVTATLLRLKKQISPVTTFRTLNRYAMIVVTVPLFLSFEVADLAKKHPFYVIFLGALIAAIVMIWVYRLAGHRLPRAVSWSISPRWARLITIVVILAAAGTFAWRILELQFIQHQNLRTGNYDLGVYVNTLYNSIHGRFLKCTIVPGGYHIYAHFDPILVLFSPVMLIHPSAETVMITEAVWIALGVIPLYLIAIHHLNRNWFAALLCFSYLLYPAIHGLTMYDFHSLSLAGPFILWAMYFVDTRRYALYFVTLVLLVLTREDLSLIMLFTGFYLFYSKQSLKAGIATIALCLIYFVTVKLTIMATDEQFSYEYYFDRLEIGKRGLLESIIITVLTNPLYIARGALIEGKLVYLLQLLVPLLGLPLLAGKRLWICFYGLVVTALVTRQALYSIAFQYATFLYPFFFALTPLVVKNLEASSFFKKFGLHYRKSVAAIAAGIFVSTLCLSYNYGVFHETSAFRAGHSAFNRNPTPAMIERYRSVEKVKAIIPADASLSASLFVGVHFAAREQFYQFKHLNNTDYYLVLDRDVQDKKIRPKYKKFLNEMDYDLIFSENGIKLFIKQELNQGRHKVLRINRNIR
ncbi:MAG: DUF2079 domain-containing protein [Deltaproteobacteria bacterium]|nr:DUF2079 domain-containing protein [Deltaproteobacteria bacterium]